MHRASPLMPVPQFTKTTVAAAEVFGVDFAATDFVNLERSRVIHSGGFAQGEPAILPDKKDYDLLVFSFTRPTVVGDATLALWAVGSDKTPYLLGTSELSADGTFPSITVDNFQAEYYLAVDAISGESAEVSVEVAVQGTYRFLVAGNR